MRSFPDLNFPAFHKATKFLRSLGYEVFNPAEAFNGRTDLPIEVYVRKDIEVINVWADCLVVLPGYEVSEIGNLEVLLAKSLKLKIFKMPEASGDLCVLEEVTQINPVELAMNTVRCMIRKGMEKHTPDSWRDEPLQNHALKKPQDMP